MFRMFLTVTDYTQPIDGFLDKLSFGGMMLLRGLLTVFGVLLILWGSIELFHYICARLTRDNKVAPAPSAAAPTKPAVATPASAPAAPAAAADQTELIAVITAAIAAAQGDDSCGGFRVVSFKRIQNHK